MSDVFADTSGWGNGINTSEPFNTLAVRIVAKVSSSGRRLITTNYVLAELVAMLTSPMRISRPQQILFLADLRSAAWVDIVHVEQTIDIAAWTLWESRPDKEWSLVDCASFVVMQQRGLPEALTTDHRFEQAGFVRLLL
ncbi:MAG: type II toxin-antitoxin system VapC family toxin [Planctomycetes bacterium]|nr:type II toxin-antitoxin system VapC family toxin [Planctomycetota bacterium]